MSTITGHLVLNYTNYKEGTKTTTGSATAGINIFRQTFPLEKTVNTTLGDDDIIGLLGKVVKATKKVVPQTGETTITTTTLVKVSGGNTNPLAGITLVENKATVQGTETNTGTFCIGKNQIVVFRSHQGPSSHNYYAYYCYFRDDSGNYHVIFLTNKERAPLVFDVQDERDLLITQVGEGANKYISTIDTSNFTVVANTSGFSLSTLDLKNTSFNLATDEKSESKAVVEPLFVVVPKLD